MREFYEVLTVVVLVCLGVVLLFLFEGEPDVFSVLKQSILDKTCLMKP